MRFSTFLSAVTVASLLTVGFVSSTAQAVESAGNANASRMKITVPQETVPTGEAAVITLFPRLDAVCSGKIIVGENAYSLAEQTVKKDVAVAWAFTPGTSDNGKAKVMVKCGREKGYAFFYVGTGKPNQPSTEKPPTTTNPDCTERNSSCDSTTTTPDCVKQNTACNPTTSPDCVKQNTDCDSPQVTGSEKDAAYVAALASQYPNLVNRLPREKIAYLGHKACSAFDSGEKVESVHKMFVGSGYLNADETKAVIYTAAVMFCPIHKEAVVKAYGLS